MSVIRRIFRAQRVLVMLAFTLASCGSSAVPMATPTTVTPVTLRVYATSATAPLINDLSAAYSLTQPHVSFEVATGSFSSMLERLRAGEMPYFITNHLPADDSLWAAPIGQDGIAVITSLDNTVSGLTTAQLRSVYQGRTEDWSQVGGPNAPITVFSREDGSGTRREYEALVMGDRRTTLSARVAPSSAAMIEGVSEHSGSIGYVSLSFVSDQVRALPINGVSPTQQSVLDNTYPLRTILYFVGLREPQDDYRAFVGWVQSQEGQAVVGRRYAPLLP